MFSPDDTIVAIATPPGRGGLGVVRVSGPGARALASALLDRSDPLEPRRATFCRVRGIDEAVATFFPSPHSYTGQDVVEISTHGSPVVLRAVIDAAMARGARLAEPGEFTLRAFLNGRIDLVQSEAVADLIDAATPLQARSAFDQLEGTLTARIRGIDEALFDLIAKLEASLDFPDEGYHFIEGGELAAALAQIARDVDALIADGKRGRVIREGATVVIAGRPNTGKSSIFNKLVGFDRAITSDVPGTTRDLLTERSDIGGIPVTLVDTAGWREAQDAIEREGVARAAQARDVASLVLLVIDQSESLTEDDRVLLRATETTRRLVVGNKSDLPGAAEGAVFDVRVSAVTGAGIDALRAALASALTGHTDHRDTPAITNARHLALLQQARDALTRAAHAVEGDGRAPEEFVLADLQVARGALEEITGTRSSEDLLVHIFARFCIGK